MRAAAIGIGSNSLRMLVADIEGARLNRLIRDREGLRVFAALDENGNIRQEMMAQACQSVNAMLDKARENHTEQFHVFATSAVRDAKNQQEFCTLLEKATGIRPEICSGQEEAELSYIGATESERSGLIDIGGGSTEIVLGEGSRIDFAHSFQMGAVRLHCAMPIRSMEEAQAVVSFASSQIAQYRQSIAAQQPAQRWIGVGGTFTALASLALQMDWMDRKKVHGYIASRDTIYHTLELLSPLTVEQRLTLRGIQPSRADIIAHGFAILLACMDTLGICEITVSEYGNLEGYLKRKYCGR